MKSAYSILLENHPKSFYHTWLLVQSLLEHGAIDPSCIFVHHTADVPKIWVDKLADKSIQVLPISFAKEEQYAFKAKQLDAAPLADFEYIVLLDTNTILLAPIEAIFNKNAIVGKIVDLPNPDIQVLKSVFSSAGFSNFPSEVEADMDKEKATFAGNLSGGLYVIPKKHLKKIRKSWKKWTLWFAENKAVTTLINNSNLISQVSLAMALHETKIEVDYVSRAYNCPIHLPFNDDVSAVFLHHFNQFTSVGLLYNHNPTFPYFTAGLNMANQLIAKSFDNLPFWEFRYRFYLELGSGVGSREEAKEAKIELLQKLKLGENESVLDVGFGDFEVLEGFELKDYSGMETSSEALAIAQKKRPDLTFHLSDASKTKPSKQYDTVICLEVLNHQNNRADYEKILEFLVKSTKKRLIVSGYNKKQKYHDTNHMVAFHEPLAKSLVDLQLFSNIRMIGKYSDVQVLLAEKYDEHLESATTTNTSSKKKKGVFSWFGN